MKHRHRVLGLLFVLAIITYLDRVAIATAGVRIKKDLGIGPEQWGWVLGVFTITYATLEVPTGSLGDRFGQRKVLGPLVLWWSLFTCLTGVVQSFWQLLVVRFFFGAGEAGAFPNIAGSIARWFPQAQRATAQGITWMGSRFGGVLSAFLMVPLMQTVGWRNAFFLFGLIGVSWVAVWWFYYRDTPFEKAGVSRAELAEMTGEQATQKGHRMPWEAVRNRNFWTILVMYHLYCWGSYFYISWMPTYLQEGRGFTESQMRYLATAPFFVGMMGTSFGGWLSDRLVRRLGLKAGRRLVGATGLFVSGLLVIATALVPSREWAVLFLALGYGAMDCFLPVSWAVCTDVGKQHAGAISGSMNMAGQAGSFLSSVAFGYMVKAMSGYSGPLTIFGLCLLASAAIFLLIDPTKPVFHEEGGGHQGRVAKAA